MTPRIAVRIGPRGSLIIDVPADDASAVRALLDAAGVPAGRIERTVP